LALRPRRPSPVPPFPYTTLFRSQVIRPDGRVRVGPVSTIGELSVLDPGPRIADVVAITDGWALRMAKEDLDEALRLLPEIAAGIITALVRRLRGMHEWVE